MKMRIPVLCLACLAAPVIAQQPGETDTDIRIGVRVDTPPFVSIDPDSRAFVGYFYDVCTTAVTRAGYQFTQEPVDATARNAFLTSGDGRFDLLCDPTTITLARIANFSQLGPETEAGSGTGGAAVKPTELDFSQIVFVANGAYAERPERPISRDETWSYQTVEFAKAQTETPEGGAEVASCADLFAEIEAFGGRPEDMGTEGPETRAWRLRDHIALRLRQPEQTTRAEIRGFVFGSTTREAATRQMADQGVLACWLPSHLEAARVFCEGRLDRYYGDLDVVRASIQRHVDRTGRPCPFEDPDQASFTYEPYAFVISDRLAGFPERFRCAIYSMFQDGTMENLYSGHFGEEKEMTNFVSALFEVNGIPAGGGQYDAGATELCGVTR
jgi:hypothetical protein